MSAPPEPKTSGMKFAERQLQRHGWKQGQGLGRKENGISEAITVKVKCGTAGVGHNSAEQFTFHWWDHIFNKSASNITIETGKDGIRMKRLAEESGQICNKKPRKGLYGHTMLYGQFVKAATLMSGEEMKAELSESSEDDEEKLDLSSANKLTDEELMKACGGRTAHKGARHGVCMSAKLARLEEQERAFLAQYKEKKQKEEESNTQRREESFTANTKRHKQEKKQKKSKSKDHSTENPEKRECQRQEEAVKRRRENEGPSKAACSESKRWPAELDEAREENEKTSKKKKKAKDRERLEEQEESKTGKNRKKKKKKSKQEET